MPAHSLSRTLASRSKPCRPTFRSPTRPQPQSSFHTHAVALSPTTPQTSRPSKPADLNTPPPNPRWLSDIKARVGACIGFGCQGAEIALAARIGHVLAREWRGLVAGPEGFYIEDVPGTQASDPPSGQDLFSSVPGRAEREEQEQVGRWRRGNSWGEGVRWGDMDSMGHVNNASYLRYAEISRVHYFRRLARYLPAGASAAMRGGLSELCSPAGVGIIYSHARLDYLLPVKYPDRLTLCHRLADGMEVDEGKEVSQIGLNVVVLSNAKQRNSVRVYEENVVYDYRESRRTAMPEWMVSVLRAAKGDEERMKRDWEKRRSQVEAWVEELEGQTVRSGKTEDMGT